MILGLKGSTIAMTARVVREQMSGLKSGENFEETASH